MADVNANIGVNIDTSAALAQLKSLQRQISQFHTSIAKSSDTAALAQKSLQKNFLNSVNAIGSFSAELRTVKTTTESFTSSLEGNKFSMREYFRYAGGATKTFGKLFKSEFDTIGKVAEERVKRLQTQYIKMGRDASGAMQAISITPTSLDMENYGTKTAIAAQKQALFNQLMKQGSTNLLNFGKNTQWAGRQLMVGFTIPLAMVGSAATKTFMDMEAQAIKFKKVYGDLFTPKEETQAALDNIMELGKQFTQYGIAVATTVEVGAEAAAAGFTGLDLQRQTEQAIRLSVLGQIDNQKALETTISLQNAFGMSSDKLADSINFLNAVENQTVVSLDDITTAIPKVAPVIQQLGGDVKDLTFFMAAMKEGGINASEGANALKSGLAALINPTGKASAMLAQFGINATEIVTRNKGNLKATVVEFATALNQLDPLNRAQAIEQMFGKFQFARLSTLFANVAKDGNQAARVLDLANASVEELSTLSEQELGMTAESSMNKFKKAVEDLKIALVPVGKAFLEAVTPIVEFVGGILEKFGNLSEGTKKAITLMVTVIGGLGPILLMTFGLLANGVANIVKLFLTLRNGYLRLTGQSQILGEQTQYLTMEQIDAAAASHSLNQAHATLTQQFTAEAGAVMKLKAAYEQATAAGARFAMNNPGSMLPRGKGYANGVVSVPGSGKGDTVPAMLTPGEAVIPADMAKKYAPLINGMIAGNIPGYRLGKTGAGKFGVSVSKAKEDSNVYKAPSVIKPQTVDASWSTMQAEIDAMTAAAEEYLREMGFNAEDIAKKIKQLVQKQASHITKQIEQIQVAGETIDVKQWNANNLIADFGGINNYLNSIHKVTETLDEQEISKLASSLNMSIDEFKSELKMLEEGIHPTTRKAGQVLGAVAEKGSTSTDKTLAYQSRSVKAGMDVRLAGDFYETVSGRAYDPTKDLKSLEQVNAKVLKLKTQILDSFNISDDIAGLSGKNVQALQSAWSQLSIEAKERLIALSGDVNAFTAALMNEAREAGIAGFEVGDESVKGIARGAKTASPSKDTIKTGEDVGKGLEIGLKSREDEVAAAGTNLGKTATQSVSRGAKSTGIITPGQPYGIDKTQGGVTVGQVARNVPVSPDITAKAVENARVTQTATDRLRSLDRSIMGASFAISSLSGMASMSGGALGNMSGTISKVTGAMFALQAVTGLLTQTNLLSLAQKRAETAGLLVGNVATKKMGLNTTLFSGGIKKLLPNLLNFGKVIGRFLGPIGMAIAAVGTVYGAFKFFKNRSDQAAFAAEGLAKAMTLSKDKIKILAELLGQNPTPRAGSGARVSANQLDAKEQTAVDELRSSEEFLKKYKNEIRAIKEATVGEATLAFNAIALDLSGQGFSKKAIKTYIDALGEEANKTDVALKFKQIDLSKTEGQAAAVKLAKNITTGLSKAFEGKIIPIPISENLSAGATATSEIKLSKDLQKELNISSSLLGNTLTSLTSAFGNQTIKAEQYNAAMLEISKTIPQGNLGMMFMDKLLLNISPKFAKASTGIKDYDTKLLLVKASLVNASIGQDLFNRLMDKNPAVVEKARKELEKYKIVTDAIAKNVVVTDPYVPPEDTGVKEKSPFEQATDQLKNQRTEMLNTVKVYGNLTKAGVSAGKAFAIAKDPILAAALATTKVGTKEWKTLIGLIKQTDAALIKSKLTELKADTAYTKQFTAIVPVLKNLGLNAEEIDDIFSDPSFAQQFIKGIKDGKMNTKDLKTLIDETVKNREIDIKFNLSKETPDQEFDRLMGEANDMFDKVQAGIEASYRGKISKDEEEITKAQDAIDEVQKEIDGIQTTINKKQRDLEIDITREIEKFQEDIDKLQKDIKNQFDTPLSKLSDEGDILSNNLSLIDRQESEINKKYDAQAAALTKISEINSEIAGQQKQQLGLADALSRGDIAAAAAAAQEMRASSAANALGRQSGILDSARSAELAGVTVNGMTRAQIEERQFQISQESFALQQQRKVLEQEIADIEAKQIEPLNVRRLAAEKAIREEEDKIYKIQQDKLIPRQADVKAAEKLLKDTQDLLKADLAIIEQNKQAWLDEKIRKDLAFVQQEEGAKAYNELLIATNGYAKGIVDKIKSLITTVTTIHNIHTTYTSSGNSGSGSGTTPSETYVGGTKIGGAKTDSAARAKMYGGKIIAMNTGGMVPKYMALGGSVGSDTVPAMLTPGEFVMNKAATKRFGPMLEGMNNSKYPSMIKDLTPTTYTNVNSSMVVPMINSLSTNINDNSSTMYNYNVGINVNESNASSNDIARAVIGQIKYIDSQRIRGQR